MVDSLKAKLNLKLNLILLKKHNNNKNQLQLRKKLQNGLLDKMTKTDQVTTITKMARNATVNIVDADYDRQKCEIVQEDLQNNNEIKCGILCDYKYEAGKTIIEDQAAATIDDQDVFSLPPKKTRFLWMEFDAPLKWDNISGIIIIHSLFVYSMTCQRPLPKFWQTYLWGK